MKTKQKSPLTFAVILPTNPPVFISSWAVLPTKACSSPVPETDNFNGFSMSTYHGLPEDHTHIKSNVIFGCTFVGKVRNRF